ncbi:DNA ligase [Streptomyces sp. NPDC051956]|uniref:ATP-dependent DNA ligase n=1 Tax=Streptomyces sp. NPDC051956 TaxID=3365677 RepID=UPI0037D48996
MEHPVAVALAEAVPTLPRGMGWWYEIKFDGHRTVLWRDSEIVRLQARSGRTVTSAWMDLAVAGMNSLRPGTVLDGEAVIYNEGRVDFAAAQSRAASGPVRARELAAVLPASYAVWDLLAHPKLGDVRSRPYTERRALLLDLLHDVPPPIQAVPATDDPDVAQDWYDTLQGQGQGQGQGIEGVVCKRATSPYRAGRIWKKVRHSDTVDADVVVGYVGPASRPHRVAVRLPDGSRVLSQALTARVAAEVARHVLDAGPGRRARTSAGEAYVTTSHGLVVEVLAGTTRHAVVTVTRVR